MCTYKGTSIDANKIFFKQICYGWLVWDSIIVASREGQNVIICFYNFFSIEKKKKEKSRVTAVQYWVEVRIYYLHAETTLQIFIFYFTSDTLARRISLNNRAVKKAQYRAVLYYT